jgi:hypothetical protein
MIPSHPLAEIFPPIEGKDFVDTVRNRRHGRTPTPISAQLIGSYQCEALGIVAMGHAPALALCRELLSAGPARRGAASLPRKNGVGAPRPVFVRQRLRHRRASGALGRALDLIAEEQGTEASPRTLRPRPTRIGGSIRLRDPPPNHEHDPDLCTDNWITLGGAAETLLGRIRQFRKE